MDRHKIDNFKRANPGSAFPRFRQLTEDERDGVKALVSKALRVPILGDVDELLRVIHGSTSIYTDRVPKAGGLPPGAPLARFGVSAGSQILINWHRFDAIDEMSLGDLELYFDDIWYPGADDIEVFDHTCAWFLLVSHDGLIDLVTAPCLER